MRYRKPHITDFRFSKVGNGHYRVTYISPVTGKNWTRTIQDMTLIDDTKNAEQPRMDRLMDLKRTIKF
jgi:hypothetical protein